MATARMWDHAQDWHDEQMALDDNHGDGWHSSCWCCCIGCNPDWAPADRSNPYWTMAHEAMERIRPTPAEE